MTIPGSSLDGARLLELPLLGVFHHLLLELADYLLAVALDDVEDFPDVLLILFGGDESAARGGALLELVLHTGAFVAHQSAAVAQREHLGDGL